MNAPLTAETVTGPMAELVEKARKWPREGFGEGQLFNELADELERLWSALKMIADETTAVPVAWRHLVDSPYTKHPEWHYTEQRPTMEPERFEPLYARPAVEPTCRIPPREFDIESHTGLYTEPIDARLIEEFNVEMKKPRVGKPVYPPEKASERPSTHQAVERAIERSKDPDAKWEQENGDGGA